MKRITIIIEDELYESMQRYLKETGKSMSGFFRVLIKKEIENGKKVE